MPEGPEIKRAADRVAKAVVGRPLREVWFENEDLGASAALMSKSVVQEVVTVGKAMLTRFDCSLTVYSHNQLYGRWYVVPRGKLPRTTRTLRWAIRSDEYDALLYSASDISVWASDKIEEHPFVAKAGVDVLASETTLKDLVCHIGAKRFARRSLGALLLDQSFVAGIGNYLRSEILFDARLGAERRLGALTGAQLEQLAKSTQCMVERAYRSGGITNDPMRVKKLKCEGLKRSQYRHYVFARDGASCFLCGAQIEQSSVAGRRFYSCPSCQGEGARHD